MTRAAIKTFSFYMALFLLGVLTSHLWNRRGPAEVTSERSDFTNRALRYHDCVDFDAKGKPFSSKCVTSQTQEIGARSAGEPDIGYVHSGPGFYAVRPRAQRGQAKWASSSTNADRLKVSGSVADMRMSYRLFNATYTEPYSSASIIIGEDGSRRLRLHGNTAADDIMHVVCRDRLDGETIDWLKQELNFQCGFGG